MGIIENKKNNNRIRVLQYFPLTTDRIIISIKRVELMRQETNIVRVENQAIFLQHILEKSFFF